MAQKLNLTIRGSRPILGTDAIANARLLLAVDDALAGVRALFADGGGSLEVTSKLVTVHVKATEGDTTGELALPAPAPIPVPDLATITASLNPETAVAAEPPKTMLTASAEPPASVIDFNAGPVTSPLAFNTAPPPATSWAEPAVAAAVVAATAAPSKPWWEDERASA